jgi:hypothetical protein
LVTDRVGRLIRSVLLLEDSSIGVKWVNYKIESDSNIGLGWLSWIVDILE